MKIYFPTLSILILSLFCFEAYPMMDGDDDSRPDAEAERVKKERDLKNRSALEKINSSKIKGLPIFLHIKTFLNPEDKETLLYLEEIYSKKIQEEIKTLAYWQEQELSFYKANDRDTYKIKDLRNEFINSSKFQSIANAIQLYADGIDRTEQELRESNDEIHKKYESFYKLKPESYDVDKIEGLFSYINRLDIESSHRCIEENIESDLNKRGIEYDKVYPPKNKKEYLSEQDLSEEDVSEDLTYPQIRKLRDDDIFTAVINLKKEKRKKQLNLALPPE